MSTTTTDKETSRRPDQQPAAENSGRAFKALATAQWKAFIRDKQILFWMLAFPLAFLLLFGAINGSGGSASRSKVIEVGSVQFVDQMPAQAKKQWNDLFTVTKSTDKTAALERLKKGEVDAVIEENGTSLVLHYSSADQVKSATVQGTIGSFVNSANLAAANVPPTYSLKSQQVEDSSLKPIQYLTPGLLGYALAMGGTFGGAMTLVSWRKSKLLRRMRLTPTKPWALVASRVVVSLVIAVLQFALFVAVAKALFGLQLTGSWFMALPLALCGTLVFMSIGLMAGAVSKSEEAASGLANLIVLPMSFLGGAFIPLDFAPDWIRLVSKFLPMGYLTEGMKDVMVRGQGPGAVVLPMAVLLGFTVVFVAIAARLFKWED
ncbi:ABC transporter permease [Calidifontibacter terrae]